MGGLADVRQYKAFEQPFWEREISQISSGRIRATIHAFDRSGIRAQDMLQLMKIGVVPFGNAQLGIGASDTPAIQGLDLPGLNPDFASVRRAIEAYRPKLKTVLREAYNVEMLAVYSYPAQVLFCARPFESLRTVGGFKVRTSSLPQSEFLTALGAIPVMTPFHEIVDAIKRKTVDCAVTGILSGHEIGLGRVTTHVNASAITWGITVFGANRDVWEHLPLDVREMLITSVGQLEERILAAAEQDTKLGFECSRASPACPIAGAKRQQIVASDDVDESVRLQLVQDTIVPQWFDRCGDGCEDIAREVLGPRPKALDAAVRAAGAKQGELGD